MVVEKKDTKPEVKEAVPSTEERISAVELLLQGLIDGSVVPGAEKKKPESVKPNPPASELLASFGEAQAESRKASIVDAMRVLSGVQK